MAKGDPIFKNALATSDYLMPDGIGIVFAANFLNGIKINKIAGFDVFMHFMNELNTRGGRCFFLGSSEETLASIKKRASVDFPQVSIGCYSPPYKNEFSKEENEIMIREVNMFGPDVLFVGMTAPKQEKWVSTNKENLAAPIICSIGVVFDFYSGSVKRPSEFWIKSGLEWLPRFLKEPRRLWRRNFVSTPMFLIDIALVKFGLRR
jgi:N-acetylglucosaminyldiphosphoundecaprenol N-acetyl-beta-D-mannosaminyltransferase